MSGFIERLSELVFDAMATIDDGRRHMSKDTLNFISAIRVRICHTYECVTTVLHNILRTVVRIRYKLLRIRTTVRICNT